MTDNLLEPIRLRLAIAEKAVVFHKTECALGLEAPETVAAYVQVATAIQALEGYEDPPAQVAVLSSEEQAEVAQLRCILTTPTRAGHNADECLICKSARARLAELGATL